MTEDRRWDLFWAGVGIAAIGAFAALDFEREKQDIAAGRTHMTGTTFSSGNRRLVAALGKHGPVVFKVAIGVALKGFEEWYVPHILDHLDAERAAF